MRTRQRFKDGNLVEESTIQIDPEDARQYMKLEGADFHRGINFLTFDGEQVRVVDDGDISLRDMIDQLITNLPEQKAKEVGLLMEYRTQFNRLNETVIELGTALGMSEADMDDFFTFTINQKWKK